MTYSLDPGERINAISTRTDGSESGRIRCRFAGYSDSPSIVESSTDGGSTWTANRYVSVPGLGMAASVTGGSATLQMANPHGDIVATMANVSGAAILDSYAESDEFGNQISSSTSTRYAWNGTAQRANDALGGLTLMGARLYQPATGRFLSPDPVLGGGANAYSYPTDPVNMSDTTGTMWRRSRRGLRLHCGPPRHGM